MILSHPQPGLRVWDRVGKQRKSNISGNTISITKIKYMCSILGLKAVKTFPEFFGVDHGYRRNSKILTGAIDVIRCEISKYRIPMESKSDSLRSLLMWSDSSTMVEGGSMIRLYSLEIIAFECCKNFCKSFKNNFKWNLCYFLFVLTSTRSVKFFKNTLHFKFFQTIVVTLPWDSQAPEIPLHDKPFDFWIQFTSGEVGYLITLFCQSSSIVTHRQWHLSSGSSYMQRASLAKVSVTPNLALSRMLRWLVMIY
jgi:hypothetical protein